MAIYLANGKCYIAYTETGGIAKVEDIKKAYDFKTVAKAREQKAKASGKCAGYEIVDTGSEKNMDNAAENKNKRKTFTQEERMAIYRKTKGHCYICGEFVDFDSFEIEHRMPLAKGGTNDFENTFCSCHTCNSMKGSIVPIDLMGKIKQIQMYQLKRKCRRNKMNIKWKIAYKVLKMLD